jgi:hypothetical protein
MFDKIKQFFLNLIKEKEKSMIEFEISKKLLEKYKQNNEKYIEISNYFFNATNINIQNLDYNLLIRILKILLFTSKQFQKKMELILKIL